MCSAYLRSNGSVSFKANGNWTPVNKAFCSSTSVKRLRKKKRECAPAVSSPAPLCSTPGKEKKTLLPLDLGWILKVKIGIGNGALPPSLSHGGAVKDGHTPRIMPPRCSFICQYRKMPLEIMPNWLTFTFLTCFYTHTSLTGLFLAYTAFFPPMSWCL